MTENQLKQFIHHHNLAVIATHGPEYPESAVIEFGDNGLELIFDAEGGCRKHQNILRSPKISVVIGWDENKTVQYEGEAIVLEGTELERYKQFYFAKNPEAKKWETEPGIVYFKVVPSWIRYTDLNVEPWAISEFTYES